MNKDAFGSVIGFCDNCRKTIYEHSLHFWVKLGCNELRFCENCVTVVDAEQSKEEN